MRSDRSLFCALTAGFLARVFVGGAIALATLCPSVLLGHQTPAISVPASEIGNAPAPMPGSSKFLAKALPLLWPRCEAEECERLSKIERLVREAEAVRWGAIPGVDPRAAENLRAQAEEELVQLLESFAPEMTIDLAAPDVSINTVDLDPQHSTLLIRVIDGEGPVDVQSIEWDITTEDFDRDTQLVTSRPGVTYFLARLRGVPDDPTTIRFSLRRESEAAPVVGIPLRVQTPPQGRLILSVRDERGRPTHALVSIRPPFGGAYREPPGAIDLRGQLNDVVSEFFINEPGRGYNFRLPGAKAGRYWITPSETDMTLPVGEWEVRVLRGFEHTPVIERVLVSEGRATSVECTVRRWIDQPSRGWWSADDHVHARLMSGKDAERLLDYAEAVDIQVANILKMGDPLRTYYSQRGFGKEYRARRGDRWLVPGQEDPRSDLGHVIGLNLKRQVRDVNLYLQNDLLAKQIHADGGLYGHTHVSDGACFAHRQMALFTPREIVDFTSIMQTGLGVGLYYDFLNLGFKLSASAGADTPYAGTMGTVRMYAYTGKKTLDDPQEWFDALRAGRTFVTNGPMLEFTVEGVGPGETLHGQQGRDLRVVARAMGDPGWSTPTELSIVKLGEKVASVVSGDAEQNELAIETTVNAGGGCWIAATAVGRDGSQAHTTPVYVPAEGGWHGSSEQAAAIAQKQLGVLDEIEEVVLLDSERKIAEGRRRPLDLQPLTNASQAEAVRERIAIAREFYLDLIARYGATK